MKRVANIFVNLGLFLLLQISLVSAEDPPGVVVSKSPDFKETFIGSPSIAILPGGILVASHVWFGPNSTKDTTVVFSSSDRGVSWKQISEIKGQFWSTLLAHKDALYLFGTNKAYGSLIIRRSDDGGKTWTEPKDNTTGLFLEGKYHTSPVPFLVHNNRIWRSIERLEKLRSFVSVISAPADADLLDRFNWTISDPISMDPHQLDGKHDRLLIGSVVTHPEAGLANLMKLDNPRADRAAILPISEDGKLMSFDPSTAFVDFPGGRSKFTVRYDPVSKRFWSLSNKQLQPYAVRNMLVLASSANLRDWDVNTILLHHIDSIWHGSSHADWHFDGNDIVAVCQTSANGATSSNNSNYLTFHRFKDFRKMKAEYAVPMYGRSTKTTHKHPDFEVNGRQFTIQDLKTEARAFASYTMTFQNVPSELDGWKFTRNVAGSQVIIKVSVKRDCDLFFMTASSGGGVIDVTGWSPVEIDPFHYSDKAKTQMAVYSRSVKRGEEVDIPQGNWSGGMLLIPPLK